MNGLPKLSTFHVFNFLRLRKMKIYHVIAIAGPARIAGPTLSRH